MKLDTTITNKSKTPKKRLCFNSRDFYEDFDGKKNNFKSLGYALKKRKVTYKLYSKIVKRFLLIYFYEVFFLDKPFFFFLGGKVKRCRVSKHFTHRDVFINEAVSFLWILRPYKDFYSLVRADLQNGSNSNIAKIRKDFINKNDVGLLPLKNKMIQDHLSNNLMYSTDE